MIVADILGLEQTLLERFIKIKRIREAPSDHITNISSVNSAQSHLALSTTLPHIFWKYQHQLCINMQLPEGGKGQSIPVPLVT